MCRKDVRTSEIRFTNNQAKESSLTKEEIKFHVKEFEECCILSRELPNLFSDSLVYLMTKKRISNEELADKAWLDTRTIQRLRTDVNQNPSLATIVKICMALKLPSMISELMVWKAGKNYREGTVDMAYRYLLTNCVGYDLWECNQVIESFNKGYPIFKVQSKK